MDNPYDVTPQPAHPFLPLVREGVYNIGLLDLETWHRGTRAAVMEVGALVYNIQAEGEYWRLTDEKIEQPNRVLQRFLNFEEQMRFKRDVDIDTVLFHVEQQGVEWVKQRTVPSFNVNDAAYAHYATAVLTEVRDLFLDCEEVWINGLSFDAPILKTLWEDAFAAKYDNQLWHFRKERDLRGFRKVLKLPAIGETAVHRAVEDCKWMAKVLRTLGDHIFLHEDMKARLT